MYKIHYDTGYARLGNSKKKKMKIGIFQDIHANLPAFKKGIEVFKNHGCSKIYHVGDLIGIGPYPKEVFELAISTPDLEFIMGNHDHWFGFGLPDPIPAYMDKDEVAHHQWAHQQIGEKYREIVQKWKFVDELKLSNDRSITFLHYGYDAEKDWFKSFIKEPSRTALDQLFEEQQSDMIFYGHNHNESDITGKSRYINLGSAGCFNKPEVRLGILEISDDILALEKFSVPYDDNGFMAEFEKRKVPARAFITKAFVTRDYIKY